MKWKKDIEDEAKRVAGHVDSHIRRLFKGSVGKLSRQLEMDRDAVEYKFRPAIKRQIKKRLREL